MSSSSFESDCIRSQVSLHGGGKYENKTKYQKSIMGAQRLKDDIPALSGALFGCLVIIAVHNNNPDEQYLFHLNLHGKHDHIWEAKTSKNNGSSMISTEDRDNYSFYLIYTKASMKELAFDDDEKFIAQMKIAFGIVVPNKKDDFGMNKVIPINFKQTLRVHHFGQRLYISYSRSGILELIDSTSAKTVFELTLPTREVGLVKLKNYLRQLCESTAEKTHYSAHMNRLLSSDDKKNMGILGEKFSKKRSWIHIPSSNHGVFKSLAKLSDDYVSIDDIIDDINLRLKKHSHSSAKKCRSYTYHRLIEDL